MGLCWSPGGCSTEHILENMDKSTSEVVLALESDGCSMRLAF